jgi:hypothetical protein
MIRLKRDNFAVIIKYANKSICMQKTIFRPVFEQLSYSASSIIFALSNNTARNSSSINISVLVTPWYGSKVPWISIAFALLLRAKGYSVTLIYENLPIDPLSLIEKAQSYIIRITLFFIKMKGIPLLSVRIRSQDYYYSSEQKFLKHAKNYAIWLSRGEGQSSPLLRSMLLRRLLSNYSSIETACESLITDVLLLPGGLCRNTSAWIEYCKSNSVRYATFDDGGVGKLMFSCSGIAAQHHDASSVVETITRLIDQKTSIIVEINRKVRDEIMKRAKGGLGSDGIISQEACTYKGTEYGSFALICLNSIWDSAALGLHSCFDDTLSWLMSTINYILTHSAVNVVIRQHPHEKYDFARGSDDIRKVLRENFGYDSRILFEDCHSKANTYDLIKQSMFVVVHSSTIGLESTLLYKPAITQASSYYALSGAVFYSATLQEYWDYIEAGISCSLHISSDMVHKATLLYYCSQLNGFIDTLLSPTAAPSAWGLCLPECQEEKSCNYILESLVTGIPYQELLINDKLFTSDVKDS